MTYLWEALFILEALYTKHSAVSPAGLRALYLCILQTTDFYRICRDSFFCLPCPVCVYTHVCVLTCVHVCARVCVCVCRPEDNLIYWSSDMVYFIFLLCQCLSLAWNSPSRLDGISPSPVCATFWNIGAEEWIQGPVLTKWAHWVISPAQRFLSPHYY